MDTKKAIYIPFAQAVPKVATIDDTYCLHMKGLKNGKDNVCGFCQKACGVGAINFDMKDEVITEKYGAIIVATGYNPIDLDKFDEFAYNTSPDVVSSLEFERLCNASGPTNGHLKRPSDGKEPKNIVFIQCVGSRCAAGAESHEPPVGRERGHRPECGAGDRLRPHGVQQFLCAAHLPLGRTADGGVSEEINPKKACFGMPFSLSKNPIVFSNVGATLGRPPKNKVFRISRREITVFSPCGDGFCQAKSAGDQ